MLACLHADAHPRAFLLAKQCLPAQMMALEVDDCGRIDACSVHHDGEFAVCATILFTHDGYGLSGFHALSHLHEVLCVVGIHRLKPVAVAYHHHIAHFVVLARESDGAFKHRLYGVALLCRYFDVAVFALLCLSHRQRE